MVNTNLKQLHPSSPLILKDICIVNIVFSYEIGGLINHIVAAHPTNKDTRSFDFYHQENHCPCCSGRRVIEKFDFDVVIQDKTVPFWDGLLHPDVMEVLKYYQYPEITIPF